MRKSLYEVLKCKKTSHLEVTAIKGYTVSFYCSACNKKTGNDRQLDDTLEHFDVLEPVYAGTAEEAVSLATRRQNSDKLMIIKRPSRRRNAEPDEFIYELVRGVDAMAVIYEHPGAALEIKRYPEWIGELPPKNEVQKMLTEFKAADTKVA